MFFFLQAYSTLRNTETDEAMMERLLELIGKTPFDPEDLKVAGFLFFKKLRAAMYYKPGGKYRGVIKLFKAKDNFISLSNEYGLAEVSRTINLIFQAIFFINNCLSFNNFDFNNNRYFYLQVCTKQVTVQELEGDHRSILTGDSVKEIARHINV